MTGTFQIITSAMIGVGLAASCGFRVFVPMLFMSCAAKAEYLHLSESFQWVASWPALIAFGVATLFEIAGYCVPWFDHALDLLATPAAVVAGILATSACINGSNDFLKWSFAIVAGGGAAGVVQAGTVLLRSASTATTGGLGNIGLAALELVMSLITSVLAVVVPFLACLFVLAFSGLTAWLALRWRRRRKAAALAAASAGSAAAV
jgi:hypothetical protein